MKQYLYQRTRMKHLKKQKVPTPKEPVVIRNLIDVNKALAEFKSVKAQKSELIVPMKVTDQEGKKLNVDVQIPQHNDTALHKLLIEGFEMVKRHQQLQSTQTTVNFGGYKPAQI